VTRLAIAALLALLALPAGAAAQDARKPIVGGGSFNTAPLLGPGRYSDTVAAGETVYWKIKVAKGQVLQANATVDTSQIQTDVFADDYESGLANLEYRLDIHSALREQFSDEGGADYATATDTLEGDDEAGAKSGSVTAPRILGFEQVLAGDFDVNKFTAPGELYVSLSASDREGDPAELPVELPVEFELSIDGEALPSSVDFARDLPATAPEPEQPPAEREPELAADNGVGDPVLTIGLVGAIALVGGAILGTLAVLVLGRPRPAVRRRPPPERPPGPATGPART
jgi:hypothetical protein